VAVDRMTRFEVGLFEAAVAEGRRENRSARQQLEHWTRLGMEVSAFETAARRRVAEAIRGATPLSQLGPEERFAANVGLDIAIRERAEAASFGRGLLREGIPAVALDENGVLTDFQPTGSSGPSQNEI
jgi:ParD-like antitoxin of type II bacterial toxin-antitoxin system